MKITKFMALAAVCATATLAAGAHATSFTSTFENVPGGPTPGHAVDVNSADGWTAGDYLGGDAHGIELQNNRAGAPAATGGQVFVELDTNQNSSMSHLIADAGSYDLSYLYSPRPNEPASTNGIEAFIDGVAISPGVVTAKGGATTSWSTISTTFTATANSILTFSAEGTSDSLGGYIDNISVSAAPEPSTWLLLIAGVGTVGFALRRKPALGASLA